MPAGRSQRCDGRAAGLCVSSAALTSYCKLYCHLKPQLTQEIGYSQFKGVELLVYSLSSFAEHMWF